MARGLRTPVAFVSGDSGARFGGAPVRARPCPRQPRRPPQATRRRGQPACPGAVQEVRCAPKAWEFPALPDCDACGHRGAMWPEIAADKQEINWLFLFLGQMLGCCTLEQLMYFCMNKGRYRTGAKSRVLYSFCRLIWNGARLVKIILRI
ncbi:hypothetical protein SORBI_3003G263701 [Sorghum bicolor]|uniref:DUF7086 domain-containing protein n=1 Tax=Sorghum bicolor TaxID=4558 RepID=A0A1W0VZ02_SORBI|nr:hypothetical protein SORBI_3003G263701 [Sorghum bicolor]